jgi:hypothetical protein
MGTTRITISLDAGLLATAKTMAARSDQTLGAFIEDALQRRITAPAPPPSPVSLPTWDGSGLPPGIDPASNSELFALLDDEDVARWSSQM